MRRFLIAAVALLGLAAIATETRAAPMLSYRVFEDGILKDTGNAAAGWLNAAGNTGLFHWSISAFGTPLVDAPGLGTQTTSISSPGFTQAHSIRIEVTQTDLPSASATGGGLLAQLANSFTANFLIGGAALDSVSIANYVDENNAAFGRSQLMASAAFDASGPHAAGSVLAEVMLPNTLFSETMVFEATFTGGPSQLHTSSQITVPEPASFALFGLGLIGLGAARRLRQTA